MLWLYDDNWFGLPNVSPLLGLCANPFRPELLHPFASVIDSPELVDSEPMVGLFQ